MKTIRVTTCFVGLLLLVAPRQDASAAILYSTGFDAPEYVVGDLDGQNGWSTDFGPTDRVRVRNDVPNVGGQALWSASGGGGVPFTRGIRSISPVDLSGGVLTLSSRVILTTGTRSDWEISSVYGTTGLLGGLRILGNDEYAIQTSLGTTPIGVLHGGFPTLEIEFDFVAGTVSARSNGSTLAGAVAFDNTNTIITDVAAVTLITPRVDAIALDQFQVSAINFTPVPEPSTIGIWSLLGLVGAGVQWRRRRKA